MYYRSLVARFAFASLLMVSSSSYAGNPVPDQREPHLPHVCVGGPKDGQVCTLPAEENPCPNGSCEVNYLRGPGTMFRAEITLIVDDDVSKFDDNQEVSDVIAATALLEFRHNGEKHVLAQTYQNLAGDTFEKLVKALQDGPFLADGEERDRRIAESRLSDALDPNTPPSLLDSFLFQEGDREIADAIRAIFGVAGRPVVAGTPDDISVVEHFDREADGLASLVRLKVKIRFIAPQAVAWSW